MIKNKQAILLINGVPYTFPRSFIESEDYAIASEIQMPTAPGFPPLITPGFRTANITLSIPLGEWKNRLAYKVAKEVIRVTQFAFAQRNNYINAESGNVVSTDENNTAGAGRKLKIPFTKLEVPWEIQISCAYFGVNVQLACCIVSGFTVSSSPSANDMEIWSIGLTEYDVSQIRNNSKSTPDAANKTSWEAFIPPELN